ncbi:hypothetical protein A3A36_02700 [Candidatus Kaiserbacteria bacterium RIFCSPLOWO2_01_FULL_52_12b]|uniref:DNA polymerase III delta N-terminal domain-containing protein n=1 Tax=Candidatus Kaiserbacteria bacterium RIFCSPLOWO2_01_FULL_52_12b TaxID=1798509 RepID=A0A1F6EWR5_9BACT|nr:MAG: hypothetical protein A3A36_02700 [Candidatus Kaiserbacteria bacterium RIFCSPLOWO2_01_FULL_52_12b]
MIYLFYGSDVEKTRSKAFEWVAKARTKEPNLAYVRLAREELDRNTLEDAALSGGLFVKRLLILIDDPFPTAHKTNDEDERNEEESAESVFEEHIEALAASDNAIIILVPRLAAAKAKKLVAKAKMAYKFDKLATLEDKRGFNSTLVDALGARSREKLWLEVNRALIAGDAPEMLHGLLHWKARDLMAKGGRAWAPKEARALSLSLIELLQSSRRGNIDLSLSLEKFALSI